MVGWLTVGFAQREMGGDGCTLGYCTLYTAGRSRAHAAELLDGGVEVVAKARHLGQAGLDGDDVTLAVHTPVKQAAGLTVDGGGSSNSQDGGKAEDEAQHT